MSKIRSKISKIKRDLIYQAKSYIRTFDLTFSSIYQKFYGVRLGHLRQFQPKKINLDKFSYNISWREVNPPLISIVTPSFNQGEFIGETIESVVFQDYPNIEYIIQDGGSTDSTMSVIEYYKKYISSFSSAHDGGQAEAINAGMAKATGQIMAWINSDDVYLPGTFSRIANAFIDNPDVDVVYGNRLLLDSNGGHIGNWIIPYHDADVLDWADYIPQETVFWRRSAWERVGSCLNNEFKFALDWDLLLRFKSTNANFYHLPYFLAGFRIHEEQKTSSQMSTVGIGELSYIRKKIHGKVPTEYEINNQISHFLMSHKRKDLMWRVKNVFSPISVNC